MSAVTTANFQWLRTGDAAYAAMLAAIDAAQKSIRLQTYIFTASALGETFRAACIRACGRGVRVQVLVDAVGSMELPDEFWEPLSQAGGHFRWFNRVHLDRFAIRDHRKILVCDDHVAFVGGFNIAPEYEGNGVDHGWCDHGMRLSGTLAHKLAHAFDTANARAEFRQKRFLRLRKTAAKQVLTCDDGDLLLGGPGLGKSPIRQTLGNDLLHGTDVQIAAAYFLPPWRIRKELAHVVKRGGRVQLLLAGKSDVQLSQLASRSLYAGMLRGGVEIYEYQPQVLHAKLVIMDDIIYVGSANLDARSLNINYELMVRMKNHAAADEAREIFAADLKHAVRIDRATWRKSRTFWNRLKERWACFLLARVDPYIALHQLKSLR